MDEKSISATFKDATDRLQERTADLGEQTARVVRENVPRARQAITEGYGEAVDAIRSLATNRSARGWAAAGLIGLAVGLLIGRRRS